MAKEYTVLGAQLKCPMGTAPSSLIVLPQHRVQLGGKFKANIGDCAPMVNVPPFGLCKSMANPAVAAATAANKGALTPMPCTPTCSIWIGGKTDLLIDGMPALMKGDKAVCPLGASMIEVKDSGQSGGGKKGNAPARLPELKFLVATEIIRGVAKKENIQVGGETKRSSKEGATFGEEMAHAEMLKRGMKPMGDTDGVYHDGKTGIDGIYEHPNPPPDYVIAEFKYNKAKLEKDLADGTNQMDDDWVRNRLDRKVSEKEAKKIRDAMKEDGLVEKWKIQVKPDGTTSISKIDEVGDVIRGNAGKVI